MSEPQNKIPVSSVPQVDAPASEGGVTKAAPAFQLKASSAQSASAPIQRATPEDELTGHFNPKKHSDFVHAQAPVMEGATEKKAFRLRKESTVAWNMMQQAASAAGITLTLVSATRNYDDQKRIWDGKWDGAYSGKKEGKERSEAIMEYSSMPGSSRHHWGTDVDINSTTPAEWADASGKTPAGKHNQAYKWLLANAAKFGWGQTYDAKGAGGRTAGYNEERWHWSYIPLSAGYQAEYKAGISDDDIGKMDFKGAKSAKDVGVVDNYVNSVAANTMSSKGYGRPTAIDNLKVTASALKVYYDPKTSSGVAMTLKKDETRQYYQEITVGKIVWRLVDEGWIKHSETKGEGDKATTETFTEIVSAAPTSEPSNESSHSRSTFSTDMCGTSLRR